MNPASGWRPASLGERIQTIDIIRGLALFGVLIVNILGDFRLPLLEHILKRYAGLLGTDLVVEILAAGVLEFKALTIFSFLFGVGIAIQIERASSRNVNARHFLARRLAWLLVLGAMHMLLVWNGDILALYAFCGLVLLPLAGMPWQILVLIGTAFVALPEFAWFGIPMPSGLAAVSEIARTRAGLWRWGLFRDSSVSLARDVVIHRAGADFGDAPDGGIVLLGRGSVAEWHPGATTASPEEVGGVPGGGHCGGRGSHGKRRVGGTSRVMRTGRCCSIRISILRFCSRWLTSQDFCCG